MAIFESVSRLAASFVTIIQTRLELAAVEVEEEFLRLFSYILLTVAALFCLGVAVLLAILLIVVMYWDTNRIPVLIALISVFGVSSILIAIAIFQSYQKKPRLLSATLSELTKDIDSLKPSHHS